MKVLEPLSLWLATLQDGSIAQVWANAVGHPTQDDARYTFGVLVDASPDEQWASDMLARTSSRPERVEICVASFPAAAVASVSSGMAAG